MTCVSDLRFPPALNLTLLSLFIFMRHGERTPIDTWLPKNPAEKWICDNDDSISPQMHTFRRTNSSGFSSVHRRYRANLDPKTCPFPTNCAKGQLTVKGTHQLKDLGQFYHSEFVTKRKFLPDYYDPNTVHFRSSQSDRAVRSLISFLVGFYPDADDPEEIVTISTGTQSGREPLNPDPYSCKDLQDAYAEFISTDEFRQKRDQAWEVHDAFYKEINLEKTHENWQWIGDFIYSYYCNHDQALVDLIPKSITDKSFELAMNDTAYYSNGFFDKYRDIPAGPIWRLLFEEINKKLSGETQTKFTVFSGHDTTIAAITAFFGHADMRGIAPYRSHLAVEMYESDNGPLLRFSLNGDIITVNDKETVSVAELKQMTINSVTKCIYNNEL